MLLNTNYAQAIPHEYLATVKLSEQNNFQEYELLKSFPISPLSRLQAMLKKLTNS